MKRMSCILKTLSPVLISMYGNERNLINTMDYIPGSTLLGVAAKRYIEKTSSEPNDDPIFKKFFLSDKVRFTNAYICEENYEFFPTPFFVQKSKGEEMVRTSMDTLPDFKSVKGYSMYKGEEFVRKSISKIIFFHNTRGIDGKTRLLGHSDKEKGGGIFNYEAIEEGQFFKSYIYGDEESLKEIKGLFKDNHYARVGRSKTVQYGNTEITFGNIEETPEHLRFKTPPFFGDLKNYEVIFIFTSPVILPNKYGMPEASVETFEDMLKSRIKKNLSVTRSIMSAEFAEHYVSVLKSKRPMQVAFSPGSVFLVKFDEPILPIKKDLAEIIQNGFGLFTNEGNGEIDMVFPDEIDIEREKIPIFSFAEKLNEEPHLKRPRQLGESTKKFVQDIISVSMKESVANLAFSEAAVFTRLPKNSILGKLEAISYNMKNRTEFLKIFSESFEKAKEKGKLKGKATEQLEECRMKIGGKQKLLKYITEDNKFWSERFFNGNINIDKLAKEIDWDIKSDEKFIGSLHKVFWPNFFKAMRKIKEGEENG